MSKNTLLVVAALIVAVTLVGPSFSWDAKPDNAPKPTNELKEKFKSVNAEDAEVIRSLYLAMSVALKNDDSIIKRLSDVADATGRAIDLAFNGRKISDGDIGDAIDRFVARRLDLDEENPADIALTPEKKIAAIEAFQAISEAASR